MENVDNSISMRNFMPGDDGQVTDDASNTSGGTQSVQAEEKTQTVEQTVGGNFDPNKLPPELQQAYKQMQADYTRKTQELAEARKFYEAYSQYTPLLSYIAQNPSVIEAYLGNKQEGAGTQQEQPEVTYPDDPVEFAKQLKEEAKKEAMMEFMNFYNEQKQAELAEAQFIAEADEAAKIDPRLEEDDEFSDQVVGLMARDQDFLAGRKSVMQATKEAIAKIDAYLQKKIDSEKQKLTEMAKAKRSPSVVGSPRNAVSQEQQPKTMREAAAEFLD